MFMHPQRTPESAWLGHIPFAGWLIEVAKPSVLVELGTHRGASYLAFCQAVQRCGVGTKCYGVDTWQGDEHAGEYSDEIFLSLLDYHQRNYAEFSRLLRMRFDEALEYFDPGVVDVLHIDGLHTYEAVREDFETWLPKMSGHGVVLFHDINVRERGFGVWKFWSEICSRYPFFEFTHTHGLGVLLVGADQPEELQALCAASSDDKSATLINRMFDQIGRLITSNVDIGTLAGEQGRLNARVSELTASNAALVDSRDAIQRELDKQMDACLITLRQNGQLIAASTETAVLLGYLERLQVELVRLNALVDTKDAEIQRLNSVAARVAAEDERMRQTLSWRLTAPLRGLSIALKGLFMKAGLGQ